MFTTSEFVPALCHCSASSSFPRSRYLLPDYVQKSLKCFSNQTNHTVRKRFQSLACGYGCQGNHFLIQRLTTATFFFFCQCHRSEVCSEAWRSKFIMKQTTSQMEVRKMQKRKNSGYQLPWYFKVCKWSWRRRFCWKGAEYGLGVGCPCWSKSRVTLGSDSMPRVVRQTASPLLSTNG